MQSIEYKIFDKVKKRVRGTLIFPEDFYKTGSSEAVRLALHRLEKEKVITRVAQGIYVRPKESKYVGKVLPSAEEVANGIAKRDRVRTIPTGAYAMNVLGLSTQIPMKIVLLTDGSPREIKVGRRTIKFKKTAPKNLLAKGAISSLVIQALREIGKGKATERETEVILKHLGKEEPYRLEHDIKLAPEWIRIIMRKALKTK
jgi:hypothetical protein